MNIKKIEHIGIAVKSLEKSRIFYEKVLGLSCYREEVVPDQKVKTAFYQVGNIKIELLEATAQDSPIATFIEKKGEGMHHIAFETNDLENNLKIIEKKGIRLIDKQPRPGTEQLQIAFLHPGATHGVLIELCEHPYE